MAVKPAFSFSAVASENTWTTKAPIPQTGATAVVNGKIYVISDAINYEYDPATDSWVEKTPMPTPRHSFGIITYQNKIYTIGGRTEWNDETGITDTRANEVYDPSTDTWETKKSMPTTRGDLWANVVDGKIHLISDDAHDVYDIATDSWNTSEPLPLSQAVFTLSSTVFNDKIYIFGRNETCIYDPKSDTLSFGAVPPVKAFGPAVCATTGVMAPKKIYVFGGSVGFLNETNVTQVYDPETDTWTFGEPMLTARVGVQATVVDDVIFVIGGGYGWGFTANVIEQYTPFGYGTVSPKVDVVSPISKAYNATNVSLVFTVNKPATWAGYSLDGQENVTVTGNFTLSGLSSGLHNVTMYANDTLGNMGASATISFNVELPFPTMLVVDVFVASAGIIAVGLLVYFKKRKH
jgi:hypothetical protein